MQYTMMNVHEESEASCWQAGRHRKVIWRKVPLGAWLLSYLGVFNCFSSKSYRLYILVLTFICYAAYHMSRKPFSVVANVLAPNCNLLEGNNNDNSSKNDQYLHPVDPGDYELGWPPFNGTYCKTVIGAVDYAWLFTYAVFMVGSGLIADRVNLRYFLTVGMIGSGVFVGLLGVAYYAEIHHLAYFIIIQIFVGIFESTGWPAIVAIMGNWFGKQHRGLLLGIWNSHTSVGNILGTAVPSIWAKKGKPWAWSFLVPGFVMVGVGLIMYFFLILEPSHVGLPPPEHHLDQNRDKPSQISHTRHRSQNGDDSNLSIMRDNNTENEKVWEEQSKEENRVDEYTSLKENNRSHEKNYRSSTLGNDTADIHEEKTPETKNKAISLLGALKVPGVIEFSFALFFAKLVAYTFLFWLPYYLNVHTIGGHYIGEQKADLLATLYDVGGIIGGIFTGGLSDIINARAISCVIMMYLAVPTLFIFRYMGHDAIGLTIFLIILSGTFINGPYALITTAVSSDLGTHKSLKDNQRAKATVGAIIDGMGSLGAAFGPLVTGWVSDFFGWDNAFNVLMVSCFLSSLMLSRLVVREVRNFYNIIKVWREKRKERKGYQVFTNTKDKICDSIM